MGKAHSSPLARYRLLWELMQHLGALGGIGTKMHKTWNPPLLLLPGTWTLRHKPKPLLHRATWMSAQRCVGLPLTQFHADPSGRKQRRIDEPNCRYELQSQP